MIKLGMDRVHYHFALDNEPRLQIKPGEEILVETDDCFRSQLVKPEDSLDELDWDQINPTTGPIYIEGAHPGDTLKVNIEEIEVAGQAAMIAAPGEGLLGDRLESAVTRILPVVDNQLIYNDQIRLPLKPMIGVIGTAPAGEPVANGTPGEHGGNMDCKRITAGSTIYLPVAVPGALLALGDLHAVMADGEIIVCGAEVRGRVRLRAELIKDRRLPLPMLEDRQRIITIASAESLDEAVQMAVDHMADYLVERCGFSLAEAGMLLSLAGDTRICQVVDPLKTARMEISKKTLGITSL